jgi:nitrogen fixation-related uncharacterized protein
MSFVRFWVGFTIIGLSGAVMLLLWALKRRQFRESDRAGYLALSDITGPPPENVRSKEAVVLLGILGIGVIMMVASVVLSFIFVAEE